MSWSGVPGGWTDSTPLEGVRGGAVPLLAQPVRYFRLGRAMCQETRSQVTRAVRGRLSSRHPGRRGRRGGGPHRDSRAGSRWRGRAGAIAGMTGSLIAGSPSGQRTLNSRSPCRRTPPAQLAAKEPRRSCSCGPGRVRRLRDGHPQLASRLADPLKLRIESVPVGRKKTARCQTEALSSPAPSRRICTDRSEVALDPGAAAPR